MYLLVYGLLDVVTSQRLPLSEWQITVEINVILRRCTMIMLQLERHIYEGVISYTSLGMVKEMLCLAIFHIQVPHLQPAIRRRFDERHVSFCSHTI